jgi:hypothetical protein
MWIGWNWLMMRSSGDPIVNTIMNPKVPKKLEIPGKAKQVRF